MLLIRHDFLCLGRFLGRLGSGLIDCFIVGRRDFFCGIFIGGRGGLVRKNFRFQLLRRGYQFIDDQTRITPFVLILAEKLFAHFRKGIICTSAAIGLGTPIFVYEPLRFQSFKTAVKRRLLYSILAAAFLFDLADDIVPVSVAFLKDAEDNGIDMTSDHIAVYGIHHIVYIISHIAIDVNNK